LAGRKSDGLNQHAICFIPFDVMSANEVPPAGANDSEIVHWGHDPLAVPRRTESADKSDALKTLRARGRQPNFTTKVTTSKQMPRKK